MSESRDLLDRDELEMLVETGQRDLSEIEDQILETAGISSAVWGIEEGEETIVGHVLLADYDDDVSFPRDDEDDHDVPRRELIEREISDMDGVTALLRSSAGSYHVWNLTVENLSARVLKALAMHGDPMHVAVSWRRSQFILRCSPKVLSTSIDRGQPETYKDAPELVDVFHEETDKPQSRGHYAMLETLAEHQDREDLLEEVSIEAVDWIGSEDKVTVSQYFTVTDQLKREVW